MTPPLDQGAPPEIVKRFSWAAEHENEAMTHAFRCLSFRQSTLAQDMKEATDFVTSDLSGRWGSRMRKVESARKRRDITFRSRVRRGDTEIDKLKWLDFYLYAWVDGQTVVEWIVFRVQPLLRAVNLRTLPEIWNRDGKSAFVYLHWQNLQLIPGCVVGGETHPSSAIVLQTLSSDEYLRRRAATGLEVNAEIKGKQ